MNTAPSPGTKVYFGRSHGEQTLGVVVKVNRSRCKVRQLDSRGTYRSYPVGSVWTVPFTLLTPAPTETVPVVAAPSPERSALQTEIDRLRAENARLRGDKTSTPKRAETVILNEIRGVYSALSPENLWMDGEATRGQARARAANLNRRLRTLFVELGRRVSEDEAYR